MKDLVWILVISTFIGNLFAFRNLNKKLDSINDSIIELNKKIDGINQNKN